MPKNTNISETLDETKDYGLEELAEDLVTSLTSMKGLQR